MLLHLSSVFSSIIKFVRRSKIKSNNHHNLHSSSTASINDNLPADKIVRFGHYLHRFALIQSSMKSIIFSSDEQFTKRESNWQKFYNHFVKVNSFSMLTSFIIKLLLIKYSEQTDFWLWILGDIFMLKKKKKYFYNVIMTFLRYTRYT